MPSPTWYKTDGLRTRTPISTHVVYTEEKAAKYREFLDQFATEEEYLAWYAAKVEEDRAQPRPANPSGYCPTDPTATMIDLSPSGYRLMAARGD